MTSDRPPREVLTHKYHLLSKRIRKDYDKIVLSIAGLVVFFLVWHIASISMDESALPTPGEVIDVLFHSFEEDWQDRPVWDVYTMQDHVYISLTKIIYGAILALIFAIPMGLVMGFSRRAEAFFLVPIELIRPIPPIAWLAFAIAIISVSPMDVVFIIFLGIFFPIFINTMDGVKKIDPLLVDAAQTLGANRLQIFYKVILPATVPQMMTGLRVGVGVGWMTIVAAEMVSANGGIGWFIWTYGDLGRYVIARGLVWAERRISK
jgi:NitT/TauT family transport system permease protein